LADLFRRWLALSELDRRAFLALAQQASASAKPSETDARVQLNETWRILAVQTLGAVRERFLDRERPADPTPASRRD
jgi:hypothetical protein